MMRLKRKVDGSVVEVEVGKKSKKPVSRSVKLAHDRAKKRELSNCSNEVISGEEYLRGKE
jgi:hypothetical protein